VFACAYFLKQSSAFKDLSENLEKFRKYKNKVYLSELERWLRNLHSAGKAMQVEIILTKAYSTIAILAQSTVIWHNGTFKGEVCQ